MNLYKYLKFIALTFSISFLLVNAKAETGYELWLRYQLIDNKQLLEQYRNAIHEVCVFGNSETIHAAKREISDGLEGLLGDFYKISDKLNKANGLIIGNILTNKPLQSLISASIFNNQEGDGFLIQTVNYQGSKKILITAKTDIGVLYGVFNFLKLLQTHKSLELLNIRDNPKVTYRILNHWDNLDRTVERGYAGFSLWDWQRLPGFLGQRYTDYARANASIGINGAVLNNVNANALILTPEYLVKVAALANVFRPYGIKVYLTSRFSAPIEIGGLKTADPLDTSVIKWWKNKVDEIYSYVPDFGGFLVKANSEGQPGPQNYGRTHADGANMLAAALAPHHGVVMWRAFVYDNNVPDDRAKQAYNEFKPLDGKFLPNVLVQVKNGPIDFQPREPFHPLFGAMPQTPLMMEFQVTQEYLGFATHLVFLGSLYEECLKSDTYAKGKGSLVAKIIEGTLDNHTISGVSGVSNIGNEVNWTGHPFAQANWYAFGRLAWNPELSSKAIAEEWIRTTFSNSEAFITPVLKMMMESRENTVNYMTPLGLHHIMGWSHHYGPGPWIKDKPRADWTAVYYHKADTMGVGFNRTSTGSNALGQYFPDVQSLFENLNTCPDAYLLWFHHVPWTYKMKSGRTLWDELCFKYYAGVDSVRNTITNWEKLSGLIDDARYNEVKMLLSVQLQEAETWRNSCVLYFQQFSRLPIPQGLEKPAKSLEYYENLTYHFVPGN